MKINRKIIFILCLCGLSIFSCRKPENIYAVSGTWEMYGITKKQIVIDTALADKDEINTVINIIDKFHLAEDTCIKNQRNQFLELTDDGKYLKNGEELGNYTFIDNILIIYENNKALSYGKVFLNKHFLSYSLNRTSLFQDTAFMKAYGIGDSINLMMIDTVLTEYHYRRL